MTDAQPLRVNRAPVLTLWASVVAETLGYDPDAAATLGKAVAGLNAQSKGRSLGIFSAPHDPQKGPPEPKEVDRDWVVLLDRRVPVRRTPEGVRALAKGNPVEPAKVESYLKRSFGHRLSEVRQAMRDLAAATGPERLERSAYRLYEGFRPEVPSGRAGWGAKGELDLERIRALAPE